jgi:Class II Aldolase and Adducin N-terminal domain
MKTFASGFLGICLAAAAVVSAPALAQQLPASAGPADPQLIEDLIAANRILAMQGVVDAMGHVSVRHNRDPNRYLLSLARAPELVTEADIMEYDLDSNPVRDPGRRQYSERYIHGEIYKLRPDVVAVVHAYGKRRPVHRQQRAAARHRPFGRLSRRGPAHVRDT